MLSKHQLQELKEHLESAQNPIFYYDNDADGLCSFLIFRRWLGRGSGVAVRSYPDLNASYAKKAEELKADIVFVLDKPVISKEFITKIGELHLPLIFVDHHSMQHEETAEFKHLTVYNAATQQENENAEPVTYLAYKLTERKEDVWIAVMGCIADHYLPDFVSVFEKDYPELWKKGVKKPFDAYYGTEIGKLAQALNFGLKDSTTHVVQMQQFLISCASPHDVLAENKNNHAFLENYYKLKNKYDSLVNKAESALKKNLLFFEYSGESSMSSEIANELSYRYQKEYIVVAYHKGAIVNISLRGDNVRRVLEKVLKALPDSSGGGHRDAVGARIKAADLPRFYELFKQEI